MKQTGSLSNRRQKRTNLWACAFLAPAIILLVVFILYPIVQSFVFSTYDWNGIAVEKIFIGFGNWKKLLEDTVFWKTFRNNITILVLSILIQIPIALIEATFLEFSRRKNLFFKICWFLPYLMSSVAIGYLFSYALAADGGIVSAVSHLFGGKNVDMLGNQKTALYTVIMVIAWQFVPFYMVYMRASYTNIETEIYDAALVDGATNSQYFWRVALPILKPSIRSAAVMSMVGSLGYFDLIFVMTYGGPGTSTELMATYMYKNSFKFFKMGYGSTIACGMFLLITAFSLVTLRFLTGKDEE